MPSKPWYQSKLVWAGVITAILSILPLVQAYLASGQYDPSAIVGLVSGILTVVLRVGFTDQPIAPISK